jgi:hypothetical protein
MGLEIDHSWAGNCVFPDLQLELGRDLGKSVDLSTGFAPGCMLDFRRLRAMSRIRERRRDLDWLFSLLIVSSEKRLFQDYL